MPKPIFTQEHIDLWNKQLDDLPKSPTELDWPDFKDITAFNAGTLTSGIALRLKAADGGLIDIRFNPVAARTLAQLIFENGQQAGWLDETYEVISPLAEFDA
jgi:hypothetical protein